MSGVQAFECFISRAGAHKKVFSPNRKGPNPDATQTRPPFGGGHTNPRVRGLDGLDPEIPIGVFLRDRERPVFTGASGAISCHDGCNRKFRIDRNGLGDGPDLHLDLIPLALAEPIELGATAPKREPQVFRSRNRSVTAERDRGSEVPEEGAGRT